MSAASPVGPQPGRSRPTLLLLALAAACLLAGQRPPAVISGVVLGVDGEPLPGARVRLKATRHATLTDEQGRFRLDGLPPSPTHRITAWADGYYVAGADVTRRDQLELRLAPLPGEDHPDYAWLLPEIERDAEEDRRLQTRLDRAAARSFEHAFLPLADSLELGCRDCHGRTIVDQWAASAHARGVDNPLFRTMYLGTDVQGRASPPTRKRATREYGELHLPPDPDQPWYGPGYRLDFPGAPGNCAVCHLPGAALDAPYETASDAVDGVDARGSHCDFCHKTRDVKLDPDTGRPAPNLPGVLSLVVERPPEHEQVFFGPYDDVDVGPDTFAPAMQQSRICAPCHDGVFWGTQVYGSYPEWLASSYADEGVTCQDCHMRPDGETSNFAPGRGGLEREPSTVASHFFPGAADADFIRDALHLEWEAVRGEAGLEVRVRVANDGAGHHVPTGSPMRQLLLLVEASSSGEPLELLRGPTLPTWVGDGEGDGDWAGLPGKAFAKVLQDRWSGRMPAMSYWNPMSLASDTRLAAGAADDTLLIFEAGPEQPARVRLRLVYRRALRELSEQKGWDVPDLVLVDEVRAPGID